MPTFIPVSHDPFAQPDSGGFTLERVDYDPFATDPERTATGHARELGVGVPRGIGTGAGLALQGASALEGDWWPKYQDLLGAVESVELDGPLPPMERFGQRPAPVTQPAGPDRDSAITEAGAAVERAQSALAAFDANPPKHPRKRRRDRAPLVRAAEEARAALEGAKALPADPPAPGALASLDESIRGDMDLPPRFKQALRSALRARAESGSTRQIVRNPDGSISTERTATVPDPRTPGAWMNVPTMFGGRQVSEDEAIQRIAQAGYRDPETGRAIASFSDMDKAVSAAEARSAALAPLAEAYALIPAPLAERPLFRAGEAVTEAATAAFPRAPGYEDALSGTVGEGLGSLALGVGVGLASGPASPVTLATLFGSMGAGEAAERARQAGASPEEVADAARLGVFAGSTDVVPLEVLMRRVPEPARRAVGELADRVGATRVVEAAARTGVQGLVEGVQEGVQQFAQNLIAREVHSPEQRLGEGILPAAGVGDIVGSIAGLGREGVLAIGRRRSGSTTGDRARAVAEVPPPSPEDEASPLPTDAIQEGRESVADAMAAERANQRLDGAGIPHIGMPVRLNDGTGRMVEGVVTDAETDDQGAVAAVSVTVADDRFGGPMEIEFTPDELAKRGIQIEGMPMPPSREEQQRMAQEGERERAEVHRQQEAETSRREADSEAQSRAVRAEAERAGVVDALAGVGPVADAAQLGEALAGLSGTPDGTKMLRALAGTERTAGGDMVMRALAGQGPMMNAEHLGLALTGMQGSPDGDALLQALTGRKPQETTDEDAIRGRPREVEPTGPRGAVGVEPSDALRLAAGSEPAVRVGPDEAAGTPIEGAARPVAPVEPAPEVAPELVTRADGQPFKTRQAAMLAARNKRIEDAEPVEHEGGWALQRAERRASRVYYHGAPRQPTGDLRPSAARHSPEGGVIFATPSSEHAASYAYGRDAREGGFGETNLFDEMDAGRVPTVSRVEVADSARVVEIDKSGEKWSDYPMHAAIEEARAQNAQVAEVALPDGESQVAILDPSAIERQTHHQGAWIESDEAPPDPDAVEIEDGLWLVPPDPTISIDDRTGDRGGIGDTGIHGLAVDEGAVLQPEARAIPDRGRPGGPRVSGVADQLSGIPSERGPQTGRDAPASANGRGQRLRAEQRAMEAGAPSVARRADADRRGVGERGRGEPAGAGLSPQARDAPRTGDEPTSAPRETADVAPIVRKNGQPFASEKSAALAAKSQGIIAEPVRVQDGWALRRLSAEDKAAKAVTVLPETRAESFTPDGRTAVETELAVVDAADLIVSHDAEGRPDPRYPAELQPRERGRATSQAQIREMAGRLNPGMLGEAATTDTGAPIVGPDGAVESGNGRAAAIRLAYRRGQGDAYRAMVETEADRAGVDTAGMTAPVLVRVRRGGTADRAAFARASNVSAAARMSASERAKADVETAGRDVLEEYARDPVRAQGRFVEALPATERSAMFDAEGRPSRELRDRVRNAVLWQAYGSDSILRAAAESEDPDGKQLLNALTTAAPRFAEVDDGVKTALNAAVDRIATARATGMNNKQILEQVVGQQELIPDETFDDGARAVAQAILERARSGKRMGEYLVELGERARRAEESAAYGGVDLLGEVPAVDVATVAQQADEATRAPVEVQGALLQRSPDDPGTIDPFDVDAAGRAELERMGETDAQVRSWQTFDETAPPPRQPQRGRREPARDPGTRDMFDPQGSLFQRPAPATARIRLQRRFSAEQSRVKGDIERIGRDVFGKHFAVRVAESIEAPDGTQATGAYDPANRVAYVALRSQEGMTASVAHEGLHHLRNMGAFTDAQGNDTAPWKTLEREADARWIEQYGIEERYGPDTEGMDAAQRQRLMREEAIAEALADFQTRGRETGFGPTVRSALTRIINYFNRIANALRGRGFATARDIFESDIATGEAGRRADARQGRESALDRQLMTAWHGSPHRFDRFSTEGIGGGEGTQFEGWGLYFSGKKEVAEWYREQLTEGAWADLPNRITIGSKTFRETDFRDADGAPSDAWKTVSTLPRASAEDFEIDIEEAVMDLEDQAQTPAVAELLEAVKGAKHGDITAPPAGATYRVDLAPAEDEYLLWREPLAAQSEKVKEGVRSIAPNASLNQSGADFYKDLAAEYSETDGAGDIWNNVPYSVKDPQQAASMVLHAAGVRGVKYPTGDGSDFNYVIFDDADVAIEEVLLQRGKDTPESNKRAFDESVSRYTGADLRGAAEATIADKERMGGLAETIKTQVQGIESVRAKNVEVKEAHVASDLFVGKRWVVPPHHATRKQFPAIHSLIMAGVEGEKKISNWTQRLDKRWDRTTKRLSKAEFADLTGVLFLGDAEAHVFTDAELDGMGLSPKVKEAYRKSRRLLDAMGTMVENHNRKMTLPALARRTKLLRRLANAVGQDAATFRTLYNARAKLLEQQRRGDGDPEELAAAIDKATEALYGADPAAKVAQAARDRGDDTDPARAVERFESEAAEADRISARLADNKIKRRVGYVPHKFFGRWRIFKKTGELDEDGKPKYEHIAGEHGFWPTRSDAIRAASHMARKGPDGEYQVSQVEFDFPAEEATQLSDAAFFRFIGNVQELTGLKGDDLREAIQGTARRRFRRRIAGFSQYRKGVKGYSKNLDRVMRTHIGQTVRHVVLDELKYRAINTMEKEGLSENRTTVQSRPELAAMVQSWWRDVNGQKQPFEQGVDAVLAKPWASPLKVGTAAGAAAFVASKGVVGVATMGAAGSVMSLGVPLAVAGYVGYRVGRALSEGGVFPSRSLAGAALGDMSHLKLGMVFNLMSPAVNLLQTATNTVPVLGTKWTGVGVKRFSAAVASKLSGKPNADWRQLERANIRALDTFAEGTAHAFKKPSRLGEISMSVFQGAESFNRGVAFLGGLSKAQDEGKSPAEQREYANHVMDRTQLNYEKAAKPELLRNNFLRVPLQFKNYVVQQLGFVLGLRGAEIARFTTSMTLIAGALGLPFADIFDELTQWVTEKVHGKPWSPIMAAKMAAIDSLEDGGITETGWQVFTRGLPGAAGVDFLGRVGMGDKFLPTEMRDFWGPWASTVLNAVRHGQEGVALTDQLRNLSPGIGGPLKALESWANGGEVSNPWKGGKVDYVATPRELMMKAIGARPIREARLQDIREHERMETMDRRMQSRRVVNRYVKAMRDGNRGEAQRILADARRRGVALNAASIRRAMREHGRVRPERELRALPRDMRREALGRRQAVEQAATQ